MGANALHVVKQIAHVKEATKTFGAGNRQKKAATEKDEEQTTKIFPAYANTCVIRVQQEHMHTSVHSGTQTYKNDEKTRLSCGARRSTARQIHLSGREHSPSGQVGDIKRQHLRRSPEETCEHEASVLAGLDVALHPRVAEHALQ